MEFDVIYAGRSIASFDKPSQKAADTYVKNNYAQGARGTAVAVSYDASPEDRADAITKSKVIAA